MEASTGKNSGFTLVELLVSMTVVVIVGLAITAFVMTGIRQYTRSGTEINLQYESQMTQNQIQEMVIGATNGIVKTADSLEIYNYEESVADKKSRILLRFDSTEGKLYYTKQLWKLPPGGSTEGWVTEGEADQTLGTLITYFEPHLYDKDGNEIAAVPPEAVYVARVEIAIGYELNGRSYESNNVIALRNPVVASTKQEEIYPLTSP